MIRVLVVEDSPTVREFLLLILCSDPAIEVVATAETGEEALEAVELQTRHHHDGYPHAQDERFRCNPADHGNSSHANCHREWRG